MVVPSGLVLSDGGCGSRVEGAEGPLDVVVVPPPPPPRLPGPPIALLDTTVRGTVTFRVVAVVIVAEDSDETWFGSGRLEYNGLFRGSAVLGDISDDDERTGTVGGVDSAVGGVPV